MKRGIGWTMIVVGAVALFDALFLNRSENPLMPGYLVLFLIVPGVWLARRRPAK